MTASIQGRSGLAGKLVAALAALGLVAMFASSIMHRLENPSRVEVVRTPQQSAQQGMPQGMADMGKLMEMLRENPDDPKANLEIAKAFLHAKDPERAQVFVQRALKADPNNQEALHVLSMTAFQAGQHDKAAEALMRLLAKRPDDARAHFNLAVLYNHYLNDAEKGAYHLDKARQHAQGEPELLEMIEREAVEHGG